MINLIPLILVIIIIYGSILLLYKDTKVKDLISFFFVIYLVILSFVVTSAHQNYLESNFTPFKEIFRYDILSPLFIKNIIGNILLFIPLGLFITYKLEIKRIYFLVIIIYFSVTIETIQLIIGRVFDIDDIILNTFGGVIGFIIYRILKK